MRVLLTSWILASGTKMASSLPPGRSTRTFPIGLHVDDMANVHTIGPLHRHPELHRPVLPLLGTLPVLIRLSATQIDHRMALPSAIMWRKRLQLLYHQQLISVINKSSQRSVSCKA